MEEQHPIEDRDSWEIYQGRQNGFGDATTPDGVTPPTQQSHRSTGSRRLHHHSHHVDAAALERKEEAAFWDRYRLKQDLDARMRSQQREEHDQTLKELWANPGINQDTVHGLMIDAGSTGSRMHVYEWAPRILTNEDDIADAVTGNKLSFPGTDSRWTDRLRPGLASFAELPDDQLRDAVADYLQPLLDFAKTVLHAKEMNFEEYPIFLRATAGMRILNPGDRARVMQSVRDLFSNKTYCPFAFTDEQARVLSGEEESIYDWTAVNFLMGNLLVQSEGAGTVFNPKLTHGALDLGGASTQISFYEPHEDIMSNLFKLQIGQAKHWNVYAHSFLFYGINEAINRFQARLAAGKTSDERLVQGIYNPCFPGGISQEIRTDIHFQADGSETWNYSQQFPSGNGFYQAVLKNDNKAGDFDMCMNLTKSLLHLEKNSWCDFAHKGDCSLSGTYQPALPRQSPSVGEFIAFSNYYHIWKFLKLPEKATLEQLRNATRSACSMSHAELVKFNNGKIDDDELNSYCFRAVYAFQLLHNGYGFALDDTIRVTNVINGRKVGWAIGSMLFEINSMPWRYRHVAPQLDLPSYERIGGEYIFLILTTVVFLGALFGVLTGRRRSLQRYKEGYEPVQEIQV